MTESSLININAAKSQEIAQKIKLFQANGGAIQEIPRGVSGGPTHSYNNQRVKK